MTTTYEYDEGGRLTQSVATSEPRWTEQDRAEVLALRAYDNLFCPCGCGQEVTDTLSATTEWTVTQATCNARLTLLEHQRAVNEQRGSENAPARLWQVQKRE